MRILVVEDDIAVREVLSKMIGPEHEVVLAQSYDEAVEALKTGPFNAAAVDLTLGTDPDGGCKVASYLRLLGVPKIVIITGAVGDKLEQMLPTVGTLCDALIQKPLFTVPELLRALGIEPTLSNSDINLHAPKS